MNIGVPSLRRPPSWHSSTKFRLVVHFLLRLAVLHDYSQQLISRRCQQPEIHQWFTCHLFKATISCTLLSRNWIGLLGGTTEHSCRGHKNMGYFYGDSKTDLKLLWTLCTITAIQERPRSFWLSWQLCAAHQCPMNPKKSSSTTKGTLL